MKNLFAVGLCVLLSLSMFACGQQEAEEPDPGAAGQAAEVADTTRLDSAVNDLVDSAAAAVQEAAEEAVDQVEEAADKAVEEVTGH